MVVKFDITKLNAIIADANKNNENQSADFTKVGYLKNGKHKLRFFVDPEGEVSRKVTLHQFGGKKCLCPNMVNRENEKNPKWAEMVQEMNPKWKEEGRTTLPECEICEAGKEVDDWTYGFDVKYRHIVYGALYESNAADDYWVPDKDKGTPYAIVGKTKFKNSLYSMLEALAAEAPEFIVSLLTPTTTSSLINVEVTGGTQGSVNMQAIPAGSKPAIFEEPPEWYRPLNKVFIDDVFTLASYEAAVTVCREWLKEWREKQAAEGGNKKPDGESGGGSDKKDGDPDDKETDQTKPEPAKTEVKEEAKVEQTTAPKEEPKAEVVAEPAKVEAKLENVEAKPTPAAQTLTADTVTAGGDLPPNKVRTKKGEILDLPEIAIQDQCWTQFDATQKKCLACKINLMCMTESRSN